MTSQTAHYFSHVPHQAGESRFKIPSLDPVAINESQNQKWTTCHPAYPDHKYDPISNRYPNNSSKVRAGHNSDSSEHILRRKTPNGIIAVGYEGATTRSSNNGQFVKHRSSLILGDSQGFQTKTSVQISRVRQEDQNELLTFDQRDSKAQSHSFGENGSAQNKPRCVSSSGSTYHEFRNSMQAEKFSDTHFGNEIRAPISSANNDQIMSYPISLTGSKDVSNWPNELGDNVSISCRYTTTESLNKLFEELRPMTHLPMGAITPQRKLHNAEVRVRTDNFTRFSTQEVIANQSYSHDTSFSKNERNTELSTNIHAPINRWSLTFDEFYNNTTGPNAKAENFSSLKEKTLSWAHLVYVELITFLGLENKNNHISQPLNNQSFAKGSNLQNLNFNQPSDILPLQGYGAFSQRFNLNRSLEALPDIHTEANFSSFASNSLEKLYLQNEVSPEFYFGKLHQVSPYQALPPKQEFSWLNASPIERAREAQSLLINICRQTEWQWVDGMLLCGCFAHALGEYHQALEWFARILEQKPNNFESISNLAATLTCMGRIEEAERYWLQSIKLRPDQLEAVEQFIGLLFHENRGREALEVINYVESSLRLSVPSDYNTNSNVMPRYNYPENYESHQTPLGSTNFTDNMGIRKSYITATLEEKNGACSGFGSSGFSIRGSENGRVLALFHAKGNLLYSLGDLEGAVKAFEKAVLISAGNYFTSIKQLINKVIETFIIDETKSLRSNIGSKLFASKTTLLLLSPRKALQTAQMIFSENGDLPGLLHLPEGPGKRAAILTTSNSLLSLAKIFQDSLTTNDLSLKLSGILTEIGDILALYYLSLSLQPSPSTANNIGILLAGIQQASLQRSIIFREESIEYFSIPDVSSGSSISLAVAYYNYGLGLDPGYAHIYTNLGSLLKDNGQLTAAITMYEKAVACDSSFDIALANLANAVKDQGRTSEAIKYYRRAVASSPNFAEAVCGLTNALNSVCDWAGRGGVSYEDGKQDRWHVDETGMIIDGKTDPGGSGLMKRVTDIVLKQLKDGSTWGCGSLRDQTFFHFLRNLEAADSIETWAAEKKMSMQVALNSWSGRLWEGARIIRLVERAIKRAMHRWYIDKYIEKKLLPPSYYPRPQIPSSLVVPTVPTVLPFHTFTYPLSPKQIRMISQRNALRISCSTLKNSWMQGPIFPPPQPPALHLNIGYVSSDFNNHPLAHLMQSVFGMHNTSRVKAFCYATTSSDNSIHRQQIEREAPVFYDANSWSADQIVEQIIRDDIHILVNLNGYTRGARNEIFAARPAPIQMSFMGFAGTLGAEWCDYLLADEIAIPPDTLRPWRRNLDFEDQILDEQYREDENWVYSENIIFCRDTFFCCDHAQSQQQDKLISWDELQSKRWRMRKELFPNLSDDAVILGNFNQLYKIEPTTFRTWLRILDKVPKAILWLLRFPELGERNLKKAALDWAGEDVARRIWFTNVAPKDQHISRACVCDLFLDTPECNAHTTAADVLWSCTPILTLSRYKYKMCSRIAASILKSALPRSEEGNRAVHELIATDDVQYEKYAIYLATELRYKAGLRGYSEGVGRLIELRKLLYDNRWTCALFDTKRWVSDLECAYEEAWRRWVADEGGDIYL
ncbi:unnamed protein product [Blumeria hordei]|uniref:protein O-GlcNAc transferase n=1 Tax=Blumeria hordei TaxID=2867405 RepID=A0A383UMR1_BLUHO|nr:unnamed protein product [Blumeria hordei]